MCTKGYKPRSTKPIYTVSRSGIWHLEFCCVSLCRRPVKPIGSNYMRTRRLMPVRSRANCGDWQMTNQELEKVLYPVKIQISASNQLALHSLIWKDDIQEVSWKNANAFGMPA